MRHLARLTWTGLLLYGVGVACGSNSTDGNDPDTGASPDVATSLTFVPGTVLELTPLQTTEISLAAGPPGQYLVRLALLPDRPNATPNDASLDRAETWTDSRGVATVSLTAPSTPSTFTVQATIDDLEARLPVAVSDKGYGTVIAKPMYRGVRPIEDWVASVRIGISCAELSGFPPPDGALVAHAAAGQRPTIQSVPVGPVAALSVRSGQFAYGCTNVPDLGTGEERVVPVEVADRPMQLAGELELKLFIKERAAEWEALLDQAVSESLAAFRNGSEGDIALLLDDMEALSPDPEGFAEFRVAYEYDAVLSAELTNTTLFDQANDWLRSGVKNLGPLQGKLELRKTSAVFRLLSASGVTGQESGFLGAATWSAFANPGDTLALGGALHFQPNQWVVSLATAMARKEYAEALDAAEALALVADCASIGTQLAEAAGGSVYPTLDEDVEASEEPCDASCAAHLCEAALVAAWTRAGDADGELTRMSIGVTGTALVDDEARPISLSGSWLGTLSGPSSAIGGKVEGVLFDP